LIDEVVELILPCLTPFDVGIELGSDVLDKLDSSDMMLVLLDTAVRPSRDLYILFNARLFGTAICWFSLLLLCFCLVIERLLIRLALAVLLLVTVVEELTGAVTGVESSTLFDVEFILLEDLHRIVVASAVNEVVKETAEIFVIGVED